jgi:lipoprotein NlpD
VIDGFDAPRNKGIDIGGNEGELVQAAADGEVVHVGSALRGYGNLVIIRHPGDYVTAYGHNRKILVSHGQQVKRGQPIAELGRTDSDRPKLHFEIRHQGKPLDPVKYLPSR